jgi:tetratricopeptide (TPR) repeat protein
LAESCFTDLIRQNPGDGYAYAQRGRVRKHNGDLDLALGDFDQAIRIAPNESSTFDDRGDVFVEKEDYDKAIADYSEAIRLNPKNHWAYKGRGEAWKSKREYDRAISDFSEAIRLKPSEDWFYSNRADAWSAKRQYDKAIADYNEAIRLDDKNSFYYISRGGIWYAQDKLKNAMADFDRAVTLQPDELSYSYRSQGWKAKGEFVKAIEDMDCAIEKAKNKSGFKDSRARVLFYFQRFQEAIRDCEKAIESEPKDAGHYSTLALMLATCPEAKFRDGPKALALAKKAITLADTKARAMHLPCLAAAYAECEEFDKAVDCLVGALWVLKDEDFRESVELDLELYLTRKPSRAEIYDHELGPPLERPGLVRPVPAFDESGQVGD